jgi:hypothetical protein
MDALRDDNAMVAAGLAEARPERIEGNQLVIGFPESAEFWRKKIERNCDLIQAAVRRLSGQALVVRCERMEGLEIAAAPTMLSEEELLDRLKSEFGAEEVFEEPEEN